MLTQNDSPHRPVAPIFVQEVLACARRGNVSEAELLADAKVRPAKLDHLTTQEFGRIWLALSFRLEDEFFGLGARPMRPGSATLLGHAIRGAATLEVALARALRFLRVVLDDPHGAAAVSGTDCIVTLQSGGPPRSAFTYRTFFLILHGFNCWAARERIPLKAVDFPCAEPAAQNDYGDFFGVPVRFGAPHARLVFDRRYLSRKTQRSEADLKAFLRSLPEAFLRGYRDTGGLGQVIVQRFLQGPPAEWPDAGTIAARLSMSRSTLHRDLKSAGHSLGQLKDEQRRNRAIALLSRSDLPLTEVAEAVGYAEESAFYRAFHRWYGTTPGQMRAQRPTGPRD